MSHLKPILKVCAVFLLLLGITVSAANANEKFSEVRFLVFSDPHISLPASNTRSNDAKMEDLSVPLFQSALNSAKTVEGVSFALVLGDLTKDAEPWNIDLFRQMIGELDMPVYCLLGNHEASPIPGQGQNVQLKHLIGSSKGATTWVLQGKGFVGPAGYYSFDPVPGIHIVALDTTKVEDWGGNVPQEQLDWLVNDLEANKGKFTLVIGHHGLVPFDDREMKNPDWERFYVQNREEVLKILEKYTDVRYYLWGHRHVSNAARERNGIQHIVNASTVTYPMAYSVYDLEPKALRYKVIDVPADAATWESAKAFMSKDAWQGPVGEKDPESILRYVERKDSREMTFENR